MIYLDRWLVSSVGIALHRCHRGHGFKSGTGLNFFFFQVLFSTTRFSSVLSCEDLLISIHPFVSVIHTSQSEQLKLSHRANECSVWQQVDCLRCGKTRVTKAWLILLLNECEYMKIVTFFFFEGTVTNPAIWLVVLSAVRIFLSQPTGTITLSWVAQYIPTFDAIFHKNISFFWLGSIFKPINNLLILSFLSLKSLWLTEKYRFRYKFE